MRRSARVALLSASACLWASCTASPSFDSLAPFGLGPLPPLPAHVEAERRRAVVPIPDPVTASRDPKAARPLCADFVAKVFLAPARAAVAEIDSHQSPIANRDSQQGR
jgi:hypothetical protein